MTITAGIDVGSTYTKAVLVNDKGTLLAKTMRQTGFRLSNAAQEAFNDVMAEAGVDRADVAYVVATGSGRHQVLFKDIHVTDLTAGARGAAHFFPGTRTVLDVGGQTMKASRVDDAIKVQSFRLNDKCAAGTGAFLEKTARYMGFETKDIGGLLETSNQIVPISGVCAVFAESEVINHLSIGTAPSDIMRGAIESLVNRSAQLMKRVKAEPEFTLIGGILRFPLFADLVREKMGADFVNVPEGEACQLTSAVGAAILGQRRLLKLREQRVLPPASQEAAL